MNGDTIRLVLADDHAVLRSGLRMLLDAQGDMEVIGEASDGVEAVNKILALRPRVVLMDIAMSGGGGLEATQRIKRQAPDVKVLMLSMYDDESYLRRALEAGAAGYALKRAADTELLSAIRAVARDEMYLHPSLTKVLVTDLLGYDSSAPMGRAQADSPRLTEREQEVLRLVALGHTNQEIAESLVLSVKTVESYKARLMEKLGLRGRAALVRYAVESGLLAY
ncbi:MAG: response regulator transcription factor [Chloroflexi bacterium]|nr:response regulator transcription factor [Chloroflexota bacterium]